MSNTIVVSTVLDSPDLAVVQVYIKSDGASGDLSKQVVFDASALSGANPADNIWRIVGCLNGFSAHVAYDQTTESVAAVVPADRAFDMQFNPTWHQHPVLPNPFGTGTTGDVTVTTSGLSGTDEGFLNIVVQKKNLRSTA